MTKPITGVTISSNKKTFITLYREYSIHGQFDQQFFILKNEISNEETKEQYSKLLFIIVLNPLESVALSFAFAILIKESNILADARML